MPEQLLSEIEEQVTQANDTKPSTHIDENIVPDPEGKPKEKTNFFTVKEFNAKYNVPITTLYYMLNNGFVKLRNKKTKWGTRKKFDESQMVTVLQSKALL